jgi:hypothetical protein
MNNSTQLTEYQPSELAPRLDIPNQQNPSLVYLASLAPGSRRTMRQALDVIADLLSAGACDHRSLPWGLVRFQHTQAVRSALAEVYSAATANKIGYRQYRRVNIR